MTDEDRPTTVGPHMAAAAQLLRKAAPLPPLVVTLDFGDSTSLTVACESSVVPAREDVALSRLSRTLGIPVRTLPSGAKASLGKIHDVDVSVLAAVHGGAERTMMGHGRTLDHAALLEDLPEPWWADLQELGANSVSVSDTRIEQEAPWGLVVSVFAPWGKVHDLAQHFGATTHEGRTAQGEALTPTGHQLIIISHPDEAGTSST